MPVFVVGGLALGKLALHLATNGHYGYHLARELGGGHQAQLLAALAAATSLLLLARMRRYFADVTRVDAVQPVDGVHSEEVGRAILICRNPFESLDDAWSLARRFY
jgi:hypothetical protein